LSPNDEKESKRFATYGRAVVVFFTGYLTSKLDGAITAALASPALTNSNLMDSFRVLAFATTVLLVAKVTSSCRSYDSPAPAER
jgi:hypothetical protein